MRTALLCGLTLLLAACVAPRFPSATQIPAKSVAAPLAANGTIVAVRPITEAELAESAQWRARLLRGADPDAPPAPSGLVEVVVREDSGRTVALIESPRAGCVVGSRVLILAGEPARCAGFQS